MRLLATIRGIIHDPMLTLLVTLAVALGVAGAMVLYYQFRGRK